MNQVMKGFLSTTANFFSATSKDIISSRDSDADPAQSITSVCFNEDGSVVGIAMEGGFRIYSCETGMLLHQVHGTFYSALYYVAIAVNVHFLGTVRKAYFANSLFAVGRGILAGYSLVKVLGNSNVLALVSSLFNGKNFLLLQDRSMF